MREFDLAQDCVHWRIWLFMVLNVRCLLLRCYE